MPKPASLSRIRQHKRADKKQLLFANALIAAFRIVFRVQEVFGSPKRRQKLRLFREKMQTVDAEKNVVLEHIKQGDLRKGMDALDAMQDRYARPEDRARLDEHRASMQAMQQESDALQSISKASGGDKSVAAQGYREYIALHPESAMAHKYLGGALSALGDMDDSLHVYREALRLAGSDSSHGASARIDIARVLKRQGETDAAVAELQSIIDDGTPKTETIVGMAFLQLGTLYHEAGQRQQARAAWKQAAQWDNDFLANKARELLRANP